MIRIAMLLALLLLAVQPLRAIDTEPAFDDPVQQARFERITDELRCLVCQNQTIADSDAMLAKDLRRQVRELMESGATDAEITEYMVTRYGDFVLYRPPLDARTWLLWGAPVLLLLAGLALAGRVVLRRAREEADTDDTDDTAETPAA